MATQETPEWEAPQQPPKSSIFRKSNPFNSLSVPSKNKAGSFFSMKSPFSTRNFDNELKQPSKTADGRATSAEEVFARPKRTYFGQSRRRMILIGIFVLILLILIIGLAVGLSTKKSTKQENLPLPSDKSVFTGDLTFYSPGPGYGACGYKNTSTESICAVSHTLWDAVSTSSNPNNNPLCGKKIRITRYDATRGGNSSVDVEVVDRCEACYPTDLDLSLKMFTSLADESLGRVKGSWAAVVDLEDENTKTGYQAMRIIGGLLKH